MRTRNGRLPGFAETLREVEAMPEGPERDEFLRHLMDIKETEAMLGKLQRAIRDRKKQEQGAGGS